MKFLLNPMSVLKHYLPRSAGAIGICVLFGSLTACGPADIPTGINDPNEARNRGVHEWNKRVDTQLLGGSEEGAEAEIPLSEDEGQPTAGIDDSIEGGATDAPARGASNALIALSNFGTNLDNPRRVVNSLLQVRPGDAAHNTLRFGINSTVGILGLIDVAGAAGLPEIDTDFGETLHVWGVSEGNFQELPVVGPSTQRDTAGMAVDFVMNPLWYVFPWPQNLVANGFTWAGEATDRFRYSDTVDSIYRDSADSYAQSRLIYLQNRRFEMSRGEVTENDESIDLFEELYGD
ncbi:phospholipid-binding lipoprotein MlaA [Aliiruegeria haliotis]|uniref:Phospholipid-binding lipoprotein MlaA n=1 Tax=Aliiruegeria haliotis TaxID=1280846 RepID=A0A2T0RTQ8_9RHOB|nr:VacJ family lipoprotein [Aliiruegeria haliotis]PRY24463.1 phospholipid-binding lipoprotein MlaA [Aliiruegeria haliotis]